jgi:hypothetical protein
LLSSSKVLFQQLPQRAFDCLDCALGKTVAARDIFRDKPLVNQATLAEIPEFTLEGCPVVGE